MLTRLECKECGGTGFNKELKKFKIAGKSIFDVWKLTLSEASVFFKNYDKSINIILEKASLLMLGHLKVGQSTATLSGGENIRIKILKTSKTTASVLGIDEPFKGLSQKEIFSVAKYIDELRKCRKTVVVIDHTDDVEMYFSKKIVLVNKNNFLVGV